MCIAKENTIALPANEYQLMQIPIIQTSYYGGFMSSVPSFIPSHDIQNWSKDFVQATKADLNLCTHLIYIDNFWFSSKGMLKSPKLFNFEEFFFF